ncbi:putative serine/threonine-protein kinase PBL9 [Bidens hawaiensis]|uniref:putative serine/threonine-protein kinase PBL9 n=1 Tax=Bidens hawaiensis TaxID=980011 RepID=UPI00404B66A8
MEDRIRILRTAKSPEYCKVNRLLQFEVDCRIHVYEFMPKGSLHCLLFRRGDDSEVPLSWNRRLNIAVGVAKGLAYLDTTIAHIRDHVLTPFMILIDSNYNAKLSNLVVDKTYSGYVAPEDKVKGNLTRKCLQKLLRCVYFPAISF